MQFYSEIYHDSTQYLNKRNGDPITLHWESIPLLDKSYVGKKRYSLSESKYPIHFSEYSDISNSVGIYVIIRNGLLPEGVYYFDSSAKELVCIGSKQMVFSLMESFIEKDFVKEAEELYIYTGIMERIVWRFKEASYRQVQMNVGAACANTMLYAKSKGKKVFPLGAFVDDSIAVALELEKTEIPLACVAVFPENSIIAFNSEDEGMGEFAYSNRNEIIESGTRYVSRFMYENRCECINEVSKCVKIRRVISNALPGEEFPLAPSKFGIDYFFREIWYIARESQIYPFKRVTMDMDDFSTILRCLELGRYNAYGAGLLKVWVLVFDVMFVYPGAYRYVPIRKSLYMQTGELNIKKFIKCFNIQEHAINTSFALVFTADLNESCSILGERSYRYLNLNTGFLQESLQIASKLLNKDVHIEHYFYNEELKKVCGFGDSEKILSIALVGKNSK